MQELNEVSEHVFRCPKCGGTEVEVELRTKLHLLCFRCDHKWSEQTLDKRKQPAKEIYVEDVRGGQFDITKEEKGC